MTDPVQPSSWRSRVLVPLFHLYFLFRRPMTLGVRALAFNAEGHVFLVRHTYVPGWHLPGGGIEPGEAALESLIREMAEEGNLIAAEPPRLFGFYFNKRISRRDHVALYVVRNVMQTAPFMPNGEIAEAGFFATDALPEGTTPATRRRVREALTGQPQDPFW
jgi:ADP-ribose pyrophosphatase YjhB (NUDIX family)